MLLNARESPHRSMIVDLSLTGISKFVNAWHDGEMTLSETLPPLTDTAACCAPADARVLDDSEAKRKAQLFKALGDPTRLKLLSMVKAAGTGEACVCDLTPAVGLGQPTVSHHLKILVDAGLLHREKRGTWAYYSVAPGALEGVAEGLLRL